MNPAGPEIVFLSLHIYFSWWAIIQVKSLFLIEIVEKFRS